MGKLRIEQAFEKVIAQGDKAFVPYIMAGDGGVEHLREQIEFLETAGATVVELGIPFSDPVADGPVIQAAGIRSLNNGTTLEAIFQSLAGWKETRTIPIVFMTYFNLIYAYGIDRFAERCLAAGVDGLIIPDLPLEEEDMVTPALEMRDIAFIRLVAPTSPQERLKQIAKRTEGFLYAVTVKGTTGVREQYEDGLASYLQQLKTVSSAPVLAGFGVSSPETVRELSSYCDGVIVGSKIVELLASNQREEIQELIRAAKKDSIKQET